MKRNMVPIATMMINGVRGVKKAESRTMRLSIGVVLSTGSECNDFVFTGETADGSGCICDIEVAECVAGLVVVHAL